jgi:hypothetical protein
MKERYLLEQRKKAFAKENNGFKQIWAFAKENKLLKHKVSFCKRKNGFKQKWAFAKEKKA